jgi:hypothetical protein
MHSGVSRDVLLNQLPRFVGANRRSARQTREDRVDLRPLCPEQTNSNAPFFARDSQGSAWAWWM